MLSIESKKVPSLAEKNKAFSEAWRSMNEERKAEYNARAKNEEAEKVSLLPSKKELVNNALLKLKEHVCTVYLLFLLHMNTVSPSASANNVKIFWPYSV